MKIKINELRKLLVDKLKSLTISQREAVLIAEDFIGGDLKGKLDHGIFAFAGSVKKSRNKKRGKYKLLKNKPSYAYIKGNNDLGFLAADYAIKLGIAKAKKTGVAVIGAGNTQSFLRPGTWAELAANKGLIAICSNYGGGPLMAPTGARESVLSTNPLAIGIPYKKFPIVLDMAMSKRAFWHVRMARQLNKKIDKSWGIDKNGRPTADPNKLVAVLPFGGYKGYGLGLALEILTGPLVRTKVGKSTRELRGFLFILIDPKAFTKISEFKKDVEKLVRDIKNAKKLKGVKEVFIPGERAYRIEQKNLKRGYLEVDKKIIDEIKKL